MASSDKPTVLLEYYLKRLKLATMRKEYAAVAKRCWQERADYLVFLLRLAEREAQRREERAAERRILAANFPVIRGIDTFDFKAQPSINGPLIRELMRGEYVGNSGIGKTHLASALAFAACSQGRKVRFYTVMDLVTELMESQDERRLQRLQKQLRGFELIVLDELGYIPFSKARAELLFEVVKSRL